MIERKTEINYNIVYPVYSNMDKNHSVISSMATDFYANVPNDVINKDINLIFTGSSGCMIATIFYSVIAPLHKGKINLILIRKKGEDSHDVLYKERNWDCINVFVDDHIFEGESIFRCYKSIINEKSDFIFDFVVVSWFKLKVKHKIQNITNNIIYSNSLR